MTSILKEELQTSELFETLSDLSYEVSCRKRVQNEFYDFVLKNKANLNHPMFFEIFMDAITLEDNPEGENLQLYKLVEEIRRNTDFSIRPLDVVARMRLGIFKQIMQELM